VFFHLLLLDLGVDDDGVRARLAEWAQRHAEDTGVRIVIAYNFDWQQPWIDSDHD